MYQASGDIYHYARLFADGHYRVVTLEEWSPWHALGTLLAVGPDRRKTLFAKWSWPQKRITNLILSRTSTEIAQFGSSYGRDDGFCEDVRQTTMMRLIAKLDFIIKPGVDNPVGWLSAAVTNAFSDAWRINTNERKRFGITGFDVKEVRVVRRPNPQALQADAIADQIPNLTLIQQQALEDWMDGMSVKDSADARDYSIPQIKRARFELKKSLKRYLESVGFGG